MESIHFRSLKISPDQLNSSLPVPNVDAKRTDKKQNKKPIFTYTLKLNYGKRDPSYEAHILKEGREGCRRAKEEKRKIRITENESPIFQ